MKLFDIFIKKQEPSKKEVPVEQNFETNAISIGDTFEDWYSHQSLDSLPYKLMDIENIIANPQQHHNRVRTLGKWAYNTNGAIKSGIDKMSTMHTLDSFLYCKNPNSLDDKKKFEKNKATYKNVLDKIKYKELIRNLLSQTSIEGTSYFYFENRNLSSKFMDKNMSEFDIIQIAEINKKKVDNYTVISLPPQYCMTIGRYNNINQVAFDLKYFTQFVGNELRRQLFTMPYEIQLAWKRYIKNPNGKSWIALNPNNTIYVAIGKSQREKYGVPLAITSLDEIMYANYFIDTKRHILGELNNNIIYQVFPVRPDGSGNSVLTQTQQKEQHQSVIKAVSKPINNQRTSVLSLAAGTSIDQLKIDTSIFDEKNEKGIKDNIAESLGFSPSALYGGSKSSGSNFATAQLNLELVSSHIYSVIEIIVNELDKCINSNVIKDDKCPISLYILPVTLFNKDKFFNKVKSLYADCGGALAPIIAAAGIDTDVYMSMMDYERAEGYDKKYPPHQSMYTQSSKDVGRKESDITTNENTITSKNNNANSLPSPND